MTDPGSYKSLKSCGSAVLGPALQSASLSPGLSEVQWGQHVGISTVYTYVRRT
jgi:hypothetical protein